VEAGEHGADDLGGGGGDVGFCEEPVGFGGLGFGFRFGLWVDREQRQQGSVQRED